MGPKPSSRASHYTPYKDARTPLKVVIGKAQIEPCDGLGKHAQFLNEGVFIVEAQVKGAEVGEGACVDEWRTEKQPDRKTAKHYDSGHRSEQRQKQSASAKCAGRRS